MDPSQLRETTMDPNTRRLVRINLTILREDQGADIRINGYVTR